MIRFEGNLLFTHFGEIGSPDDENDVDLTLSTLTTTYAKADERKESLPVK